MTAAFPAGDFLSNRSVTDLLARIAQLHPSDRQWLLSQASAEARERLTAALEATQPDNNGAAIVPAGDSLAGRSVVARSFSARDLIASATPEHVARALQTLPAWLAAVLVRMEEWPWSAALLKRMPGGHMGQSVMPRQLPGVGQPSQVLKPALAGAILQSFARSLAAIEASASATPSPRLPPCETLGQRFRTSRSQQEL